MLTREQVMQLRGIFKNSESKEPAELTRGFRSCGLEEQLLDSLTQAVHGDNRPLNTWLFNQAQTWGAWLAWIAPVRSRSTRYAWMIGSQTASAQEVFSLYDDAKKKLIEHPLIKQGLLPPPLLFVTPTDVSGTQTREGKYEEDEFAIFQVGYRDSPVEVGDLEQRMIINTTNVVSRRALALHRLQMVTGTSNAHMELHLRNLIRNTLIHTEGHNRGHFVGAWVYEDNLKKNCVLYEAVEELRACLASVMFVEMMGLSDEEKDAYAFSVFTTRFLGYGYDAYNLKIHRRETVREITVGAFFFEWLLKERAIGVSSNGNQVCLGVDEGLVRKSLIKAYTSIHKAESALTFGDTEGLRSIGREWYNMAFPNRQYSSELLRVYNQIGSSERRPP
jgi:hypothetical protein